MKKLITILFSLFVLGVFSMSVVADQEVILDNRVCSSTNYLEEGQILNLEETSDEILEEINQGDFFYLGDNRVQYKGADSITEDNPKIKFKVMESGETLTYAVAILGGDTAKFTVKLSGYSYDFKSISNPEVQDYTVGTTSGNAYTDSQKEVKLTFVGFDSIIDEPMVKFSVNGENTAKMYEGESYNLADGSVISVNKIINQDYAGGTHAAWFCLNWEAGVPVIEIETPIEIEPVTLPIDLANYPKLFTENGRFNGYFVIGADAPALDTISMTDIAVTFEEEGFVVENAAKLDTEISDSLEKNMIVISTGCSNKFEILLRGCGLQEGEALLELYEHNGYAQLLVAGYSPEDTRRAAKVLRDYQEHDLQGRRFVVSGTVDKPVFPGYQVPDPVEITPPVNVPEVTCTGCQENGNCLPYGTRLLQEGTAMYCGIQGLKEQVALEDSCQNNYECLSNQCSNGQCIDLSGQLAETNTFLEKILNWLKSMFSIAN